MSDKEPFGVIEISDKEVDCSYSDDYKMEPIIVPWTPHIEQYPECWDCEVHLKEGISKKKGDPIYTNEITCSLAFLKYNWKEILKEKYGVEIK